MIRLSRSVTYSSEGEDSVMASILPRLLAQMYQLPGAEVVAGRWGYGTQFVEEVSGLRILKMILLNTLHLVPPSRV